MQELIGIALIGFFLFVLGGAIGTQFVRQFLANAGTCTGFDPARS